MNIPLTHIRFLLRAREQFGDKVGVVDGPQEWTYEQYASRVHQLANLLSRWGLKPGSRVAYLSYNTHHLLEAYYGVVLARGVFLPLNIRLSAQDIEFILNDCEAEFLFLHPDFAHTVDQIRAHLKSVKRFVLLEPADGISWAEGVCDELMRSLPTSLDFDLLQVNENNPAELFYTSGTTARPKGVVLTHRNLFLHALEFALSADFRESDVQLHTIPLFHVNGWGTPQYLTGLGGRHVMMRKFEAEQVFQEIEKQRVTLFSLVPTMGTALANHPARTRYDFTSVRTIMLGGAAASARLVKELEELFQCRCTAGYGLTETSPVLTFSRVKNHLQVDAPRRYQIQASTGYPIIGVELKIVDSEGRALPWDGASVGEIVVRGDGVMKGYWNRPAEDQSVFRDGWFHTGDMASVDADGYVCIVDRKKDIIISGGENIASLEVERTLGMHPAVLECAVIPVPDGTWGEVPKALVVLRSEQQATEDELLEHCRSRLAKFKVPRSIEFFSSLPKGGTGKILKRQLRERYWKDEDKRVH